MKWFRVELDKKGRVLSTTECDAPLTSSTSVFYVRAPDGRRAQSAGKRSWRYEQDRKKRARYEAEGRCRCGREREDPRFKLCEVCRESQRKVPQKRASRKAVLLEVSEAWKAAYTNGEFTAWLLREIESIE